MPLHKVEKFARKNVADIYSLTPMQQGMLFHYLKAPEDDIYFGQLCLTVCGEINLAVFKKAWDFVIEVNEVLRTVFRWQDLKYPVQVVLKKSELPLGYCDLSSIADKGRVSELKKIKVKDIEKKFDLGSVPWRVTLCKLEERKHELVISNHHILYDGWSNGIILQEFFNAYDNLGNGRKLIRPYKTKFREFIKWSLKTNKDEQESFWRDYLSGFENKVVLPVKRSISPVEKNEVATVKAGFPAPAKKRLESFVKQHKITLASLLYSAWGLLLQGYSNSDDVVFGATTSGRAARVKGIEKIAGLFLNTLPFRVRTGPGNKIADCLERANRDLNIKEEFKKTSLMEIKEYRDLNIHEELFETIISLDNYPFSISLNEKGGKLYVSAYSILENTHYELSVSMTIFKDIDFIFMYHKDRFDRKTVLQLSAHFKRIVEYIAAHPRAAVSAVEYISPEEKERILYSFNDTKTVYPKEKTIPRLFAEQAVKRADNTALVFGDEQLSYSELKQKTDGLAVLIRNEGAGRDCIVGLLVNRSLEMIIGMMAILTAGCAYLPIAPDFPQERVKYMLRDCCAQLLLTRGEYGGCLTGLCRVINMAGCRLNEICEFEDRGVSADLAYIIYTSGSTGKPKGVPITHANISPLLQWGSEYIKLNSKDRVIQNLSYFFDWSVWEIFITLTCGSSLYMIDEEILLTPDKQVDFIKQHAITVLHITPSHFQYLINVNQKLATLRHLLIGAEKLTYELTESSIGLVNEDCRVYNMYGPTETTIISAVLEIDKLSYGKFKELSSIPIGTPIAGLKLLVLDRHLRLCPVNITGELCIAGDGLSMGYLNNPGLSAKKFIACPFYEGKKIYKTGDLSRWLPDGSIEFLGRIDYQVKIRGFRIEIGEIESRLLAIAGIKECVVIDREKDGEKYLCAYVVSGFDLDIAEIRKSLSENLPDYMVPSYIVQIENIPLTPNGKLDRKALPGPEIGAGYDYSVPRDEVERKLAAIWCDILNIEKEVIGLNISFFELGGHSLSAVALMTKINRDFNVKIDLKEILESPTIAEMSQLVKNKSRDEYIAIEPREKKEYYELSPAQLRLYLVNQIKTVGIGYNVSAVFIVTGDIDPGRLQQVFCDLINRHESLRTSFIMIDDKPVQQVHKEVPFEIKYITPCEPLPGEKESSDLINTLTEDFIQPFDFTRPPILRVGLIKIGMEKHLFIIDLHHIVVDGISIRIFLDEFIALFKGEELPSLRLQYRDFSRWQNSLICSGDLKGQETYWLEQFSGKIPELSLPTDYERELVQSFRGSNTTFCLTEKETTALKKMALENDVTLYMVVLAIFYVLLSKLTGQEDIVIGTAVSGRRHGDLDNIIGMFVNTLAVRYFPEGGKKFIDFLEEVKQKALAAFANQDYPFNELVEKVLKDRGVDRNPLFDFMFAFDSLQLMIERIEGKVIPGVKIKRYELKKNIAHFDLNWNVGEEKGQLLVILEFNTRLFKPETIASYIKYFRYIVSAVLTDPYKRLEEIEIISQERKVALVNQFNVELESE